MNRRAKRVHERQLRRITKRQAEHYEPEGQGAVLMGAVELRTFGTDGGEQVIVVSVKNAGGSATVGLTVDDFKGLLDAGRLALEDVELAQFVDVVRAAEEAKEGVE